MGEPIFGVLGPLQVRARGGTGPLPLGGPKPRAVLATLLLQPGAFVSLDVLTEVLWPGGAPRSAVANVRTYVRALRRALTAAGVATDGLRTLPAGYALDVEPGDHDMLLFEHLLDGARAARDRGDDATALRGYDAALALWRGGVLQDLPSSVVWDPVLTRIEELRSLAVDECLEVRLRLGDYPPLVADLRKRLAEDPLREDLWQMLVRALYGAGRVTEARAAYAEAERVLAVELGVAPGAPLRATGEEINGHVARRRTAPAAPVCQLPMDVPDFTGRDTEIAALEELLSGAGRRPVVAVVSGPPGSGKSTLVVHVAHRVRHMFPDGQLFVDLGGLSGRPREAADVLAEMLRGLGVIDNAMPSEPGERAALLRSRLAQRRVLIVLDDAATGAQVRPLLPGTGGSAVLVSSRRRMPALPAQHCPLGVMRHDEARALLGRIVGEDRLSVAGADADRVLTGCGSLPLAVRIAGARLANRPGWTVGALADFLHDERGRLDQLQTGELEVRASAELSYRHLPEHAATAFRAFGRLPDQAVPGWLVTVAMGRPREPDRVLETLLDEHLVEVVGTDPLGLQRYRMHDLLRIYARELAEADAPDVWRERGLGTVDALIALARCANAAMPTRFLGVLGEALPLPGPAAGLARAVRARPIEWFESERRVLVAAVESALRLGDHARAADLAVELAGFFDMRGYYGDWLRTHRLVLDAVPAPPDARSAALLRNLGQLHLYQDRYADALAAFERSREVFAALGHRSGEAVAGLGTGTVHRVTGALDAALTSFTEALHASRAAGDRHCEAVAHNAIASVWLERGDPDAAAPWLAHALALSRDVGDRHREAQVRRRIAVLHELRGEPQVARAELERALEIFDELTDTHCAAYVQQSIGELCLRQGDAGQASALLVGALAVQQQLGDRRAEARVACLLGELHHATGRKQTARRYFHRSLSAWRRLDVRDQAELVDAKLRSLR
ncbi:BTAD domain-containing putative transcriptional regulator [Streptomyces sp. DH24]|uniref:AfsR/SARP family transcriptional regulator n=1 Tax=Streptomyces sp. DH24 TaxID=3040123 RepID=UPI002441F65C|nr:BTAD domain-containing putative transcriptional regulator [Streptomyces sp. DH24]MDG9717024.1 BTAD domain-containing putative transcriptional regulator [Streptomyces sp. DH24]